MNRPRKYRFSALPLREDSEKTLYEEREYGITHLPFEVELRLCNALRRGDPDEIKRSPTLLSPGPSPRDIFRTMNCSRPSTGA